MPTLKPVGHQSTNWIVRFVLMVAMAALTSLGTTSPRYSMQHAMYLPCRGSHFTIWLAGSKHAVVMSATDSCSWCAFSAADHDGCITVVLSLELTNFGNLLLKHLLGCCYSPEYVCYLVLIYNACHPERSSCHNTCHLTKNNAVF